VTLVRDEVAGDRAIMERLRQKSRVVVAARAAPLDATMVEVLRALGRPDGAALVN
jgi:hypothetical protein